MYALRHNISVRRSLLKVTVSAIVTVVLAFYCAAFTPAAHAHARLLRSEPLASARLIEAPREIRLFLSEPVGLQFSSIKLFDRARREQPVGTLRNVAGDASAVQAEVSSELAPGSYIVVWRVVSAVDGHLTTGSFAFRIAGIDGAASDEPAAEDLAAPLEGLGEYPSPLRWLARGLMLAASTLLLGGALFTVLVVEPTAAERGRAGAILWPALGSRFANVGAIAASVLIVALVFDLASQAASAGGTGLLGAVGRDDLARLLLTSTRYGFAWVLKLAAGVLLMVMMLLVWMLGRRGGAGIWEIAIAAGSLMLLAHALSSHAAAAQGGDMVGLPLPVISDWVHLVAAATWVGGLAYMGLVLFPTFRALKLSNEDRRAFLGRSVPRFSRLAIASVALLALTGTYNLLVHSQDVAAILGSQYGQVLLVKVALFVLLVALGAVNLLRLSSRLLETRSQLEHGATAVGAVPALLRNVRGEIGLAALALLCAGGLTLLPPPSGQGGAYARPPQAGGTISEVVDQTEVDGYSFRVGVRREEGRDQLSVDISPKNNISRPPTDVVSVLFRVVSQGGEVSSSAYRAALKGDEGGRQTWQASGQALAQEGMYLVTVIAQRSVPPDLKAGFRLNVSEAGLQLSPSEVIEVRLDTDPSPPVAGPVTLRMALVSGTGAAVSAESLRVSALMPSSGAKLPEEPASAVPGREGVYSVNLTLPTPGAWSFVIEVQRQGLTFLMPASLDIAPR
jgi:copper transport protein